MPRFIIEVFGEEAIMAALRNHRAGAEAIGRLSLSIGATAPHAGYVHGGTVNMQARPFLSNAIARNVRRVGVEIAEAIPEGERETVRAVLRGANKIIDDARDEAPVATGYLRSSLYVKLAGGVV